MTNKKLSTVLSNERSSPQDKTCSNVGNKISNNTSFGGWSSQNPHLFHLSSWSPSSFEGGTLQGAIADNWNILKGQEGSVYLARLEVGGIREPHWHPNAWELNFIISGRAKWSILGVKGESDCFEANAGDLIFAPQGHFHYFENASDTEELLVLIVFNTDASEPKDDIGLVASISVIPTDVLSTFFGVSEDIFSSMKRKIEAVTIAKRK
ncbi:cupin domain-containing protein [Legionella sp.]|uniref:cupin domain-containing protein n=1 Tax=Legionella sp. TaxID=459 RepID=UPI003CC39372